MEGIMGCCELTGMHDRAAIPSDSPPGVGRRAALAGLAGLAGGGAALASGIALGQGTKLRLAFCGQLLCVVPYEVTRDRGHFRDEGLDIELVYTRGGNQAMQALVGGAVDYAGTSFDVALQAYANGAKIKRFASTGRLPLFALASSPKTANDIKTVKDLENKTVAVSGLGNADHAIMLYLLRQAGVDPRSVRFATMGPNLYDALRLGQVDAGMVQEPALSLLSAAGGKALVNAMDLEHAREHLGGAYEFMGVTVRAAERDARTCRSKRWSRRCRRRSSPAAIAASSWRSSAGIAARSIPTESKSIPRRARASSKRTRSPGSWRRRSKSAICSIWRRSRARCSTSPIWRSPIAASRWWSASHLR
jgi:NitT/TauT family transport system substrate-binding protein